MNVLKRDIMKKIRKEFNKKDKLVYSLLGILGFISLYQLIIILVTLVKQGASSLDTPYFYSSFDIYMFSKFLPSKTNFVTPALLINPVNL